MLIRVVLAGLAAALIAMTATAQTAPPRSNGQSLYLPVYSSVWHGETDSRGVQARAPVSVLVSIRNTDPARTIRVTAATYFDTDGKRIREFVTAPHSIGPMGTLELFVPRSDERGGSGANFVITWRADAPTNPPLVEGLHINMPVGRSIAFITSARPIATE